MKTCQLIIRDEVNARFEGLDPKTRRDCVQELSYFIPYARHMPAFKLGHWDGKVSLFALNGNTYVNMLDRILPIVMGAGYEIDIADHRTAHNFEFPDIDENYIVENLPNSTWPKGHPAVGENIMLRDYQVEVIKNFLQNPQCLQEIATGAGKTLLTASLSHLCEPYGRTIVIVPNKSLVDQTEADYKNLGLDVGVYYGDRKEPGRTHTICTWQSLDRIAKGTTSKKLSNPIDFEDFIDGVICVMVDEAHQAKADVIKNLLCGAFANVPIRWGLTGTVPKEDHEFLSILASLGPVVNKLAAIDLMNMGVLANLQINIMQMQDTAGFTSFQEEYAFLVTDSNRLDWMSQFTIDRAKTGNTLILVNRVDTGKELALRIPGSTFVHGSTKGQDRKDAYGEAAEGDDMILIATYGVAAVGINIPRIFNLIMVEPGKSFTRVIQSIGRGIRKAKDKDFVQVYDIGSTCKFSARHVIKRKKTYKEAQYPFVVEKVDYLKLLS